MRFALKAAAIDPAQLADRARRMARLELPIRLELHTFGSRDLDDPDGRRRAEAAVRTLAAAHPLTQLVVHVPYQGVADVTVRDFDADQVRRTIDFAGAVGAEAVVVHRYWGLVFGDAPPRTTREEAVAGFALAIRDLALDARAAGVRLWVENIGHYSLLPRDGRHYLAGPLDHFFPWEIAAFRGALTSEGLNDTVDVFVDVAHATLSANLFNRIRACAAGRADPRAVWITDDDLDRVARLHPFDWVDGAMPWLHLSDSRLLTEAELADPGLPAATMTEAVCAEGWEIDSGNLPWPRLAERLAAPGRDWGVDLPGAAPGVRPEPPTLLLEVEPGPGDSHVENGAQERSLVHLAEALVGARSAGGGAGMETPGEPG